MTVVRVTNPSSAAAGFRKPCWLTAPPRAVHDQFPRQPLSADPCPRRPHRLRATARGITTSRNGAG